MITGHSHDISRKNRVFEIKSLLFICVYMLPVWCQKPFSYRLFNFVCYVYGSCTNSYLFFICGTKSSTHDLIPFCKFYRLWMGFYSTSLHHSHLFREGKNEVWCKNWCKWCISLFSFGFYSIAISPVFHFTTFSS